MSRVVIIGGGISGLSTAYYLSKAGYTPTIVEQKPRLGGVISTDVVNGCVIEGGPDSFLAAKPWAATLIRELGLGDELIGSNDHLRVTYVLKNGRLAQLPDGLMMMVPTKVMPMVASSLLSWPTKVRMGLEYFRRPSEKPLPDRSVAEFIEAHYGREAVDYLAEPLLSGVYGGDPRKLSVSSVLARFVELETKYGSLTRGVLTERRRNSRAAGSATPLFLTLKRGLAQLIEALTRAMGDRLIVHHATADAIDLSGEGYRIRAAGEWLMADHLVLACPAWRAAELLRYHDPRLASLLGGIDYSSSLTLALGYRKEKIGHPLNGFGFLVPKTERKLLVACTWVGTKFSHRVPEDQAVLRCFLGGAGSEAVLERSDDAIIAAVRDELRTIMGVSATPSFTRISRWPRSMAQYLVGHAARIAEIEERVRAWRSLHLCGNGYYGIGIPDCVRMGKEVAERITVLARS